MQGGRGSRPAARGAEAREQELLASNIVLEQHVQARGDALSASVEDLAARKADLKAIKQELTLMSSEQSLEHERLEVLDRQVAVAQAYPAQRVGRPTPPWPPRE